MADPAYLGADGRVVLEPEGAALCALALEAVLRSSRPNGMTPGGQLLRLAEVLALASPDIAARLTCLRRIALGETLPPQVSALGETPSPRPSPRPASSVVTDGLMSAREAAQQSGYTIQGVRQAIYRGSLDATWDRAAHRWWIGRHAFGEWRHAHAA
jgi:hypothetical protein